MFCPYCGRKTPDEGRFCIHCGKELSEVQLGEPEINSEEIIVEENNEVVEMPHNGQEELSLIAAEKSEEKNVFKIERPAKDNSEYIVVDLIDPDIPLLNGERLHSIKSNHLKGKEFIFSLGDNEIRYDEDVIMLINMLQYFLTSYDNLWKEFAAEYKENVNGMESFFSKGAELYDDYITKMLKQLTKFLIASGVIKYSELNLRKYIKQHDVLKDALEKLAYRSDKIVYEANQELLAKESARGQSSSLLIGGGRGFIGGLGGMAAVGVANATSGVFNSLKTSISQSSNKASMRRKLDDLYTQDWVLEAFHQDWQLVIEDCTNLYTKICELECHVKIEFYDIEGNEEIFSLLQNITEHVTDKKIILKTIAQLLSGLSPLRTNGKELKCAVDKFLDNSIVINEVLEISRFFLIDAEIENYLKCQKELYMKPYLELSETNSNEVHKKIEELCQAAAEICFDVSNEVGRLKEKEVVLKKEEELKAAIAAKINRLMEINLKDAEVVEKAFRNGDLQTVMEKIMEGSTVAEERYIQYYIQRIRDEQNSQLFDAIAKECGKNRAYDCIIAVCCHNGYGTIQDLDIASELLIASAEKNCTYAKGYIYHLVLQKKADFLKSEDTEKFSLESLEDASPYAFYWEGKALCQGTKAGGSDKVKNDYDSAIKYISYATHCGIEGAKEVLEYLNSKTPNEINSIKYGQSNSGGCYITTAVCGSFGKDDNCYELTEFRRFRDTYLRNTPDGKQLIQQYYITAPQIVEVIDKRADKQQVYKEIWDRYLAPCLKYIEEQKYSDCKNLYVLMVNELQAKYLEK